MRLRVAMAVAAVSALAAYGQTFSSWNTPVNLGSVVNSSFNDN